MSLQREDELEQFKQNINLIQYSANYHFVYSKSESTSTYAVLRKSDASQKEKLVVTKSTNGHWIYFNVHNEMDRGSIIDLIQNRRHINLGIIRKELRSWLGKPEVQIQSKSFPCVSTSNFIRESVVSVFRSTVSCDHSDYLISRGIPDSLLNDLRFRNMVKQDRSGNIIFPHYDKAGLTGYEIKNTEYTGFAKHGRRSLWSSQCFKDDTTLVFVESGIDALSYHQVKGKDAFRYHSVAGAIGGMQQPLIIHVLNKAKMNDWQVVSAFDNDENGNHYHTLLQELAPAELNIVRDIPPTNDWNQLIDLRIPNKVSHTGT